MSPLHAILTFAMWVSQRRSPRHSRQVGLACLATLLLMTLTLGALGVIQAFVDGSSATATRSAFQTPAAQGLRLTIPQLTATPTAPSPSPTPTSRAASTIGGGCKITSSQTSAEQSLLTLLNRHRAAAGVAPLTLNTKLSVASRQHSCDMYLHHMMSHIGSDGSTPLQRIKSTGVAYTNWGENIGTASGQGLMGGITQIDSGMMSESLTPYDHHWNIVHAAFTQVGLGVIYANGQVWLTEDFIG